MMIVINQYEKGKQWQPLEPEIWINNCLIIYYYVSIQHAALEKKKGGNDFKPLHFTRYSMFPLFI